jgi:hypothetical protein
MKLKRLLLTLVISMPARNSASWISKQPMKAMSITESTLTKLQLASPAPKPATPTFEAVDTSRMMADPNSGQAGH